MDKSIKRASDIQKNPYIKKAILILIIICMGVVVGINLDKFYVEKEYSASKTMSKDENGKTRDPNEISMLGSQEVCQEFIAKESRLLKVGIDFKAWEQRNGTGDIVVEVQDQNGNVLATDKKVLSKLTQSKTSITTQFSLETDLNPEETYNLIVRSVNVESAKGLYLYEIDSKDNKLMKLSLNGQNCEGHLSLNLVMRHYAKNSIIMIYVLLAIGIVVIILPLGTIKIKVSKGKLRVFDINIWLSRILFIGSVPMAFFIVQRYAGYGIGDFIRLSCKFKGILNYLLYGLIWLLIYLVCNRTKYTTVIVVILSSVMGLTNYFVWNFRGIPIMAADVASLGTAMDVAQNYAYDLDISSLWALSYTIVYACIALSLNNYKGLKWKKRVCVGLLFMIPYSFFYTQMLHGDIIKKHGISVSVWEPSRNYAKNGSLLSFFLSYTYYVVDKPAGYSTSKVEDIAEDYDSDRADQNMENRPNIIAIMNEAFSDLSVDAELATSEDYMPFIHELKDNTVKGNIYVSVFGGNTANTEFEFLTGCSMAFLPFRSIPYDTYIKGTFPSITQNLKAEGYVGNYAIHPGTKTAWSRNVVYPYFGFDEFFTTSDIKNKEYIRNFVSDESDFDFLISKYEETRMISKDPFYTFNVTIQNHGGYSVSQGLVDTSIGIINEEQSNDDAEQYINLIKKTDLAFEKLVKYFEKVDEPTVIIMFGDHQPSLSTSFYEALFGKKSDKFTLEDIVKKHTVPYIIWANYDIEEKEADMSANYLSAFFMQTIGSSMTGYQKYLMDLYEEVPMITANAYSGKDGVLHELDEKSEYSERIHEYQILQYNNMFDTENRVEAFYQLVQ